MLLNVTTAIEGELVADETHRLFYMKGGRAGREPLLVTRAL